MTKMRSAAGVLAAPITVGEAGPGDYFALLKPRVMSLVVFTALTGLVVAPVDPHPIIAITAILAIAVGAGASGALNMAYEADIDAVMSRTMGRPVASGRVSRDEAAAFGLVLSSLSVLTLWMAAGAIAAGLLAFTIFFYVVVYTMVLKPRTPQNIVIGGLAGALPPAVAWASATGGLALEPLLLVLLIFLWTPAHFWALALYRSDDYAKAGIPMLPVVAGASTARRQILIYAVLTALAGLAPIFVGLGGGAYAAVAAASGFVFVLLAARLVHSRAGDADAPQGERVARDLFAFSIFYLFILFAILLVEHAAGAPSVLSLWA